VIGPEPRVGSAGTLLNLLIACSFPISE